MAEEATTPPITSPGSVNPDVFTGDDRDETIKGLAGDDTLDGAGGDDVLYGGDGKDTLFGGDGDDTLYGGKDDDEIQGGRGDDTLDGGDGNDELWSGTGIDRLTGGNGRDTFIFSTGPDSDSKTITDFRAGEDFINFAGLSVVDFEDIGIEQEEGDALVSYQGLSIRLKGVTATTLTAASFIGGKDNGYTIRRGTSEIS